MITAERSQDLQHVIRWLQQQPGVQSVVPGRYTRAAHKQKPGTCRVIEGKTDRVWLRAYDRKGANDLNVFAEPSTHRDRWVALLASGKRPNLAPLPGKGTLVEVAVMPPIVQKPSGEPSSFAVPIQQNASQTYAVTPDLAALWLERNTRNRPLRNDVVQKYVADMKAHRWMLSPDAIGFDVNGAVVNGQHRLWAVFESGETVPMNVQFNLPAEVVRVLDDHFKRTLPDIAKLSRPGLPVTQRHTAIAKAMQVANVTMLGGDTSTRLKRLTRQEQLDFLERHLPAIEFAMRDCFGSSNRKGLGQANVLAALARAYYSADRERLKAFGKVLLTGEVEVPRADHAGVLLRNWLMSQTLRQVRSAGDLVRRKTERALKGFLDREYLAKLYEAPDDRILFRLPEEIAPRKRRAS